MLHLVINLQFERAVTLSATGQLFNEKQPRFLTVTPKAKPVGYVSKIAVVQDILGSALKRMDQHPEAQSLKVLVQALVSANVWIASG